MTKTITIIPAQPGYFLLHPSMYEGNDAPFEQIDLTPIIAWRIETEPLGVGRDKSELIDTTWPITTDSLGTRWMIVLPDGQVNDPEVCTYRSIDDAIADIRANHGRQAHGGK